MCDKLTDDIRNLPEKLIVARLSNIFHAFYKPAKFDAFCIILQYIATMYKVRTVFIRCLFK